VTQSSPARVQVTGIKQVCIVVKDLQKTVESFWNILGIGPWALFTFGSPTLRDRKCYGKPAWGWENGALAQVGPIELELFQTVEGLSVYQDWIDKHGEGLHHVKFITEDMDVERTARIMAEQGFTSILSGRFGPPEYKGQFCYFDTIKPLRAIWETSNAPYPRILPSDAVLYPDPTAISPARVKVTGINQIGIVVKDVEKTAENYWNILGIGPWEIRDWGSHVLYNRFYHDKPAWGRERLAHASIGDVKLELVQPVEGESVYQDWIDDHGEGLHHLEFLCDDVDEVSKILNEQGFLSIQSEHFVDTEKRVSCFNYIDIAPLHCIWKPARKLKNLPVETISHIPAD